jgi:hypothetical protein
MTGATNNPEGGCACGDVRYRLEAAPLIVHCCHCQACQRESGSAFAWNALIETTLVTRTSGSAEMIRTPSESGKGQKIWRCPTCRVALWSHYAGFGDTLSFIRVGTLDEPQRLPPDVHIFTRSKQPWVVLPDGARAFDVYYDTKTEWSSSSLKRLKALRAAKR